MGEAFITRRGGISIEDVIAKINEITSAISYSGDYDNKVMKIGNKLYVLYTITSSGTLTITNTYSGDIWLCGGGAGGTSGNSAGRIGRGGHGGAVLNQANITLTTGPVVIGAGGASDSAGGDTTYGGYSAAGGAVNTDTTYLGGSSGNADGDSTKPFRWSGYLPYSAGGGSGAFNGNSEESDGAVGGSNGSIGGMLPSEPDTTADTNGGEGGYYGGGKGGDQVGYNTGKGNPATAYGGGGGGGIGRDFSPTNIVYYAGGAGFAGCAMIRIPVTF